MGHKSGHSRKPRLAGYVVGFGFLLTAGVFATMKPTADIPLEPQPQVRPEQIKPGPWRVAMTDPPMLIKGTIRQRCSDCHALFDNTRDENRKLVQHTDIVLEHGANDACLNCHDKENRDLLALRNGKTTTYDHVEKLCGKCHGPIYRDWVRGSHGKTIGYWDTSRGKATKLVCTQCHEPHHPAYRPIPPLPGPHTLRMGEQHDEDHINANNPLERWRLIDENGNSSTANRGHDQ